MNHCSEHFKQISLQLVFQHIIDMYNCHRACGRGAKSTQTWQKPNVNIMTPNSNCQHASKCGWNPLVEWRNGIGVLQGGVQKSKTYSLGLTLLDPTIYVMGHAASRTGSWHVVCTQYVCKLIRNCASRKERWKYFSHVSKERNNLFSMLLQPGNRDVKITEVFWHIRRDKMLWLVQLHLCWSISHTCFCPGREFLAHNALMHILK